MFCYLFEIHNRSKEVNGTQITHIKIIIIIFPYLNLINEPKNKH